jgi:cysteinyl-tRNA synthetase
MMAMALRIFNTASSREELFEPLSQECINIYTCGPTTYDYAHVGHARTYLFYDVMKRYLVHLGYMVRHVQNFTDMDEKIMRRSLELDMDPFDLSSKFIGEFLKDMDLLGLRRADVYPRTTEHIHDCIQLAQDLIKKGVAYEADGDVYFDASKTKAFGRLIHEELKEVVADPMDKVRRVNPRKKGLLDFAIWKRSKEWEVSWESPWGRGRPGWHTECAIMSHKYLGSVVDIHGGGVDLIFPHHESEYVLSEALTGRASVRYWVHNNFVTSEGQKMSKSKGNMITARKAIEMVGPDALRYYLLSTHYRKKMDFTLEGLDLARYNLLEIQRVLARGLAMKRTGCKEATRKALDTCLGHFFRAMDSDFDTSKAILAIIELASLLERRRVAIKDRARVKKAVLDFQQILGLSLGL